MLKENNINDNAIINDQDNNIKNNDLLNICEEIKTKNKTIYELKNDNIVFNLIEKLDLLVKPNEELKTKQDEILKQNEEHKIEIIKLKKNIRKILRK